MWLKIHLTLCSHLLTGGGETPAPCQCPVWRSSGPSLMLKFEHVILMASPQSFIFTPDLFSPTNCFFPSEEDPTSWTPPENQKIWRHRALPGVGGLYLIVNKRGEDHLCNKRHGHAHIHQSREGAGRLISTIWLDGNELIADISVFKISIISFSSFISCYSSQVQSPPSSTSGPCPHINNEKKDLQCCPESNLHWKW